VTLHDFEGNSPQVHPSAFVAPGARLIGNVEVCAEASIWYNCVLRGDVNRIVVGARSNIQDGTVIHVESAHPSSPQGHSTIIGQDVLVGHLAMIHGCRLHDRSFVGLGAIVMNESEVESDAMLAAGAMLTSGKRVASGQLWAGRPAKYLRDLTEDDILGMREGVQHYAELARRHAASLKER
jgi:carbonic anhydrase/acetyltransferase-like protein (isoleucine patch superfamily)